MTATIEDEVRVSDEERDETRRILARALEQAREKWPDRPLAQRLQMALSVVVQANLSAAMEVLCGKQIGEAEQAAHENKFSLEIDDIETMVCGVGTAVGAWAGAMAKLPPDVMGGVAIETTNAMMGMYGEAAGIHLAGSPES